MSRTAAGLLLLLCALLSACGALRPAPDPLPPPKPVAGAPQPPRDLASIPDAVPRREPLSRYGNPEKYEVFGKTYRVQRSSRGHVERGLASWYGPGFHAERTSSGEPYDMYAMTAAHKTLPIPVYVRVTNLKNNRSVIVRVNDRGPFVGNRIIDMSYTAAWKLDMIREGTAPVEIRVLEPGEDWPEVRTASTTAPTAPSAVARVAAAAAAALVPAATAATRSSGIGVDARYLQAGSFTQRANAEAMLGRLAAAGIRSALIREARLADRAVFRVHVGPIDSALEADDMVERLRLAGIPDARPAHD
jgi:rare lipoprotein A